MNNRPGSLPEAEFERALQQCAAEPIHLLGRIQPHGAVVVFGPDARVLQASANLGDFLQTSAESALEQTLDDVFANASAVEVRRLMEVAGRLRTATGRIRVSTKGADRELLAHVYSSGELFVLELERDEGSYQEHRLAELLLATQQSMVRTQSHADIARYLEQIADFVRSLTGYDSVMIYRFDSRWNGEVIAQSRAANAPSYLGMHFPASDIPPQARRLYTTNLVRIVADVDAEPVPLVPEANSATGQALDMTYSALRSLSPIHIEYLRNIGVRASMVISVLEGERLWGLIACHHMRPKRASMSMREAAIFVSGLVSSRLSSVAALEQAKLNEQAGEAIGALLKALPNEPIDRILARLLPALTGLLNASGLLAVVGGERFSHGEVPARGDIDLLIDWLGKRAGSEVFACDSLGSEFAAAADYVDVAAGILATPPSADMRNCLVWFRKEKPKTVNWAGRYEEGFVTNAAGQFRLTPRKSFELWTESWRGRSAPWTMREQNVAAMLALTLPEALAQKSKLEEATRRQKDAEIALRSHRDHLEQLVQARTAELAEAKNAAEAASEAKSNFLANISHELRTPMNGILGMTELARRKTSDPAIIRYLDHALSSAKRLLALINNLIEIAGIEAHRVSLDRRSFQLDSVLESIERRHSADAAEKKLNFCVARAEELAGTTLFGDAERLTSVLGHLVENAIKFTENGSVEVFVGIDAQSPVEIGIRFEIRDTGISIAESDHHRLFSLFEQGDGSSTRKYGGTGLGLALCRRLVELMGGEIGVSRIAEGGSQFWFTARFEQLPDG